MCVDMSPCAHLSCVYGGGWVEVGEEKDLEDRRLYTRRQDMELYKEE